MRHSDAVHTSAAPDQPVLGVEAVGGERPGQDPREEDEADPPAAVDHLQDEAEAEEEEEVGHDVFLVSVNQAVGEIAPGLVPVVTENTNSQQSNIILFGNFVCLSKRSPLESSG